jgi:hypothetical protein
LGFVLLTFRQKYFLHQKRRHFKGVFSENR